MIRIAVLLGLLATNMLVVSCRVTPEPQPLDITVRETLGLVKMEVVHSIKLTTEKMKRNEVDVHVGNEIIDSLTITIQQIDSLIPVSLSIRKQGKEAVLDFAERTNLLIQHTLIHLLSLHHLYDIATYSQFETATFFPADSCSISAEKTAEAKKAIEPIARRIILFFNDHPNEKFQTVITYSSTAANKEMNDTLCKLRGQCVANLLLDQIRSNEEFIPKPQLIRYSIKWVTQREALPSPDDKKHPKRNEIRPKREEIRPNMVSLTWNMVPASLYAGQAD